MRRRVAAALGVGAITAALALSGYALGGTTTVQLTSAGPQPAAITVGFGETVSFVNSDTQNHSIVSPSFTSPVIYPGQTYSVTMDTPGKISYTQTNFGRSNKGLIVVTVNGPVQLTASSPSVVYGAHVVLSGKSPLPGSRTVTLSTQPGAGRHGAGKAWTDLATVPTSADGSFSTVVEPKMSLSYRVVVAPGISSQPVAVQVKPRLTITAAPLKLRVGRVVRVVARIVPATAATTLELKQLTGTKRARTLAQKTVTASGTVTFAWKVTQGRSLLRVEMPKTKGGSSFQATFSRSITVTGIPMPTLATKVKKPPTKSVKTKKSPKTSVKTKKSSKTKTAKKPHKKHGSHRKH
jgi:plastocyanin